MSLKSVLWRLLIYKENSTNCYFSIYLLGWETLVANIKLLNMKKLELSQMMSILGGQVSDCKAVQALACALSEKMATDKEWKEWCGLYDKYC